MAKLVSKTYGDALFSIAEKEGQLDELLEEAEKLGKVLEDNPGLSTLMNHPKISKEEKLKILEAVFKNQISPDLLGLMRQLVLKGHYGEMESVFAYFIKEVKEYKKIGVVTVTSALPLREEQKERMVAKLMDTTDYKSVEMDYRVDESLIGGVVIRIGDRVVDGSVSTKLQRLDRELSKIQLKVGEGAP
jgi:F-type H+-transporting ATPase subunit delta